MSKTAARIAKEQAGQPIFFLSDESFDIVELAGNGCKIPAHCTLVTGELVGEGTYNIHLVPPIQAAGQICVVQVHSETEDGDVIINLRANGTNIISTVNSPDSILVVLISDGQYWQVVYDQNSATNTALRLVPAGGTTGQVLAKASDDNYDLEWIDLT